MKLERDMVERRKEESKAKKRREKEEERIRDMAVNMKWVLGSSAVHPFTTTPPVPHHHPVPPTYIA